MIYKAPNPIAERAFLLKGVDLKEVAAFSRVFVEEKPRTYSELGQLLQEKWTDYEPAALAGAARTYVPLVQIPPRGIWGSSGQAIIHRQKAG